MIIFGGAGNHDGDDIGKFLWMPRIAGNDFPHIRDTDFYGPRGYQVGEFASETFRKSLMYKLSYYRFVEIDHGKGGGFDKKRNVHVVGI